VATSYRGTTVAAAVGRALAGCGVRHAFGVVGGGNILATAAMTGAGVRYVAARHEGGAMVMADAYYRTTGEVAVCTTSHGAGFTNAVTALAEAVKNRSGVVLLCGDAPTTGPRPHDIDQSAVARALGAAVVRLTDPSAVRRSTAEAVATARAEQRPVVLMLPADRLEEAPAEPAAELSDLADLADLAAGVGPEPAGAEARELRAVLDVLAGARRPVVLAGLGAWRSQAGKILAELADRTGALLATTVMASGLFGGNPLAVGICGGFAPPFTARLIGEADVVLAFGARLDVFTLHGGRLLDPDAVVVQVDLADLPTSPRVDLAVRGDAAAVAAQLLDGLAAYPPATGWRDRPGGRAPEATGWAEVPFADAGTGERIDPRTLTRTLAGLLPPARTVVLDGGHFIGWPAMYWPVPDPAGLVFTGASFQSIGMGFAGAVGAAVGRPDRTTVVAVGDGGAMMGLPELDTLVRTARSALVVVYDDASYGFEEHMYGPRGADAGTTVFADTDFAGLARSLGARAATVRTVDDLAVVREWTGRGCRGTLLLDCKVVPEVIAPYLADLLAG
jgi:thiamine pyrophosphate-dependent acetolactate synthase large subunit-like protein